MDEKDFAGLPKLDDMKKLPEEWKPLGYRDVKSKKGELFKIVEFSRSNEPPISLFSHSLERRADGWYAKESHIERQAEEARKSK